MGQRGVDKVGSQDLRAELSRGNNERLRDLPLCCYYNVQMGQTRAA
jgi:hypothetical protein